MKEEKRWYAAGGVCRKKITGEVFTPEAIGNDMLDILLARDSSLLKGTFLDPSCGDGNLLLCVLKRKIGAGIDPCDALGSLYGIELMEDNAVRCRQRLVEYTARHLTTENGYETCVNIFNTVSNSSYPHIVCYDTLKWDVERWRPMDEIDWVVI